MLLKKIFHCASVLIIVASVSSFPIYASMDVIGSYESISESEWRLTLILKESGAAEIILENWDPGDYAHRETKRIKCQWAISGNEILLKYNGLVDTLSYDVNLSLQELDIDGGAPGLVQLGKSNPDSVIGSIKLWKKPHKFLKNR